MPPKKPGVHNEWFQPLAKRSCECGAKRVDTFAWGEYVCGKWRTVAHFCANCFHERVQTRLIAHAKTCGCAFNLTARSGHTIPPWIRMPMTDCEIQARGGVDAVEYDTAMALIASGGTP